MKTAYRIQSLVDSGGSYLAATTANIHNQGARYGFYKTRSGNIETYSAVANGDQIGRLDFYADDGGQPIDCLLYTSPSPRDGLLSRMPSSA